MDDMDLAWAVDEACLNSRPSPVQVHFGGWIIRASAGPVRRTSSTCSTPHRTDDYEAVIAAAESLYSSLGHASMFKVSTLDDAIDRRLADRGYTPHAETRVLLCPSMGRSTIGTGVEVRTGSASKEWIDAWATTDGPASEVAVNAFRRSIESIALPKAFACRRIDGEPVSFAYGVVHRNLLVVEAVATNMHHRKQGHAFQVIAGLCRWAGTLNAEQACLAVLDGNGPALALYRSLGFERELYRYHYRRKDFGRQGGHSAAAPRT